MLEPSGFYYPNRFARAYLLGMQQTLGADGYETILDITDLATYFAELPPDTLDRQFDFVYFATLNQGLEAMFGARGGRGMALAIGRAWFAQGLSSFGAFAGLAHPKFQALSLDNRAYIALQAFSGVFQQYSDQSMHLRLQDDGYELSVDSSPMTWGRQTEQPVCHSLVGLLQASDGHEYHVHEVACRAAGQDLCIFHINLKPIGQL